MALGGGELSPINPPMICANAQSRSNFNDVTARPQKISFQPFLFYIFSVEFNETFN